MSIGPTVLVVAATSKKISTLKRALWIGNIRPFTRMRKKSGIVVSMPKSHSLMLGYSQEEQKDAIGICEQPRKDPEGTTAPGDYRQIQDEPIL